MKDNGIVGIAIYFAMIFGVLYFARKGWKAGGK